MLYQVLFMSNQCLTQVPSTTSILKLAECLRQGFHVVGHTFYILLKQGSI